MIERGMVNSSSSLHTCQGGPVADGGTRPAGRHVASSRPDPLGSLGSPARNDETQSHNIARANPKNWAREAMTRREVDRATWKNDAGRRQ